ncbi:MAG: hypothetical protein R3281_08075 [Balneolaceae bacterium]|nr:hypothetical protein [Balneolaceae bacterium]
MNIRLLSLAIILFCLLIGGKVDSILGQDLQTVHENPEIIFPVNGVYPNLSVMGPHTGRSESGIGALLPWADKLWMIGYVAHIHGSRIGLYEIDKSMQMRKHPESVTGTFANRFSKQGLDLAIIGPHLIDTTGHVRTYEELARHRLAATMEHLEQPQSMVYFLTMEGQFFEASLEEDMTVTHLFDLNEKLELPEGARPHYKDAFTANGRVVIANNTYHHEEYRGERRGGRLAEWDGSEWRIISRQPFTEVEGKTSGQYQHPIYATGLDSKSVILYNFNSISGVWQRYRLPKGSHSFDHAWNTEWMRIREAQTERFIMDVHGLFYELPMMNYDGKVWGIKPISYHLRLIPDFCFWRGMFVMASDQTDHGVGQPQSGLRFTYIDELWSYGKPQDWGAVWQKEDVESGAVSDPFLMTGFDKKSLHLSYDLPHPVTFRIRVDFIGDGTFETYKEIVVPAD